MTMITIKTASEIERMRQAGTIVAAALDAVAQQIGPGMTTRDVDALAEQVIVSKGATPAFKGYRGFPATACVSLNEQVVHGIPGDRVLRDGDIVSVDVGAFYEGMCSDAARTFTIGTVDAVCLRLIQVAKDAFFEGMRAAVPRNRVGDISYAIQNCVERAGFSVVRELTGHGIGKRLHEAPDVPNFGVAGRGIRLSAGMALAVEPMINVGGAAIRMLDDGWTVVTADAKQSAHYENTLMLSDEGPEILTETRFCG